MCIEIPVNPAKRQTRGMCSEVTVSDCDHDFEATTQGKLLMHERENVDERRDVGSERPWFRSDKVVDYP